MHLNGNDNNASKTVVKYAYPIVVICSYMFIILKILFGLNPCLHLPLLGLLQQRR